MQNIFLLIFLACLTLGTVSCKTKKQVVNKQQVNTRQRPSGQRKTPAQIMAQLDANKDGRLSRKEVKGPLSNNFKKIDANNNGFITLKELKEAPRPQRGPRGNRPNPNR